jgi:hypothetical protein
MSSTTKKCVRCNQELPLHSFHVSSDGRRHSQCKKCRSETERTRRKRKKDQRLDAIEADAVSAFCKAARVGGTNVPHAAELLETIMEYTGGPSGFSNLFMKQYFDSPPGGAHRTRMLETMVRLVTNNTAMGGAKKPLAHWTEDELEDELRQRLIETAITIRALPEPSEKAPAENT